MKGCMYMAFCIGSRVLISTCIEYSMEARSLDISEDLIDIHTVM